MKLALVVFLLICSNILMTVAWYWHVKDGEVLPSMWKIILISWGIALFEYCLAVPANQIGFHAGISAFRLKILQEVITLGVFLVFALTYLKISFSWNYAASFACILLAVYFAFR